jgi:hypothetical protein
MAITTSRRTVRHQLDDGHRKKLRSYIIIGCVRSPSASPDAEQNESTISNLDSVLFSAFISMVASSWRHARASAIVHHHADAAERRPVTDRIGAAPSAAQQQTTTCDPDRSSQRAGVSWRNEDGHDTGGNGLMNLQVART